MLLRSSASQLPCSVPLTYDTWPQQLDLSWPHLWLEQLSVDADSTALRQALAWAWPQGSLPGEGFPRLPSWRGLIFSQARSFCSAKCTIKQNSFSEGEMECVFVLKQIYFQFKQQTVTINGIFQNIYRHKRELFPKAVSYSARCCHRLVTHTVTPTFTPTCRICAASHSVWQILGVSNLERCSGCGVPDRHTWMLGGPGHTLVSWFGCWWEDVPVMEK